MNPIANLDRYIERMCKSIPDKAFFIDKVDAHIFVDYGCADGELFTFVDRVHYDYKRRYLGYDTDQHMVDECFKRQIPNSYFSTDWNELLNLLKAAKKSNSKTCLILSSVLHEIYSYLSTAEIAEFWNRINDFDYIVIRDMGVTRELNWEDTDPRDILRVKSSNFPKSELNLHEAINGSINNKKSFVHFLLKYQYLDNWKREVCENYLPFGVEDILGRFKETHQLLYFEHFTLPWLKNKVKEDFGVDLTERTHYKMVLERPRRS